ALVVTAPSPERGLAPDGGTVGDAVFAALANNPQLDIALAREGAARAELFASFGQFLPEIQGLANYARQDWRSSTLETLEDRDGLTVGVTVRQPVFQGFSAANRFRENRRRLDQSRASVEQTREQTSLMAAQAHAALVFAREIAAHRVTNLALVQRQLEVVEARMKAGAQSRTGFEQARMRRDQALAALEEAKANIAGEEAFYSRVTGKTPAPRLVPDPSRDTLGFTSDGEAIRAAVDHNPGLTAAKKALDAARFAKRAAYGQFAPSLSVDGSYFQRYTEDEIRPEEDEFQVVARMRIPIFAQGQNVAATRRAGADYASRRAELADARLVVEETAARTWRTILGARARREAALQSIEAAQLAVKGLEIEYGAGQRTVIDVLDGQRDLVNTQISLSQAEFDLRIAR
ncbi:MAG: TolC family protein, partial [Planctomycetota bacterium]